MYYNVIIAKRQIKQFLCFLAITIVLLGRQYISDNKFIQFILSYTRQQSHFM